MSRPGRDEAVRRHGDLQIVEDLSAHRRIWELQKVRRALGVVILILGLSGLSGARKEHGLERLDQIKYAILETTGYISIIPVI